jgi:hypothetical protein
MSSPAGYSKAFYRRREEQQLEQVSRVNLGLNNWPLVFCVAVY